MLKLNIDNWLKTNWTHQAERPDDTRPPAPTGDQALATRATAPAQATRARCPVSTLHVTVTGDPAKCQQVTCHWKHLLMWFDSWTMDSMYEINRRRRSRSRTKTWEENTFKSIPNLSLGQDYNEGGYNLTGQETDPGRMYRSLGYIPDTDTAVGNVWTQQEQRQCEDSWKRKSSKKRLEELMYMLNVTFVTFAFYVIVITLDAEDKKSEIESCGANLLTISKMNQMRGRGNLLKSNDTLHMLYTDPCIRVVSVVVKVFCYWLATRILTNVNLTLRYHPGPGATGGASESYQHIQAVKVRLARLHFNAAGFD